MKQMLAAAMLPPVFPLDCAEDTYRCADRPPEGRAGVRTSRFIVRSAGNSNVRRRAATVRNAGPAAAYAESSRARCPRSAFRCLDRTGRR